MAEYIDRENIIKKIKQVYCSDCNSYDGVRCRACGIEDAILQIEAEPAADVAPVVHGEWIFVDYDETGYQVKCSHCGTEFVFPAKKYLTKHCPECGAKMDGGNKND